MITLTKDQERIFERNMPLVEKVISDCVYLPKWQMDNEKDDLLQIGYCGLMKAVATWNKFGGAGFGHYAYTVIRNELMTELRKKHRTKEINYSSIDDNDVLGFLNGIEDDATKSLISEEDRMLLEELILTGARSRKEQIGMLAILAKVQGKSSEESAKEMGLKPQTIYNCTRLGKKRLYELLTTAEG